MKGNCSLKTYKLELVHAALHRSDHYLNVPLNILAMFGMKRYVPVSERCTLSGQKSLQDVVSLGALCSYH